MLALFISLIFTISASDKNELRIIAHNKVTHFSQQQLLQHSDTEVIQLTKDPINNKTQAYYAIAVSKLLKPYVSNKDLVIHFKAKDGMNVAFKSSRLLDSEKKASNAYLAIKPTHFTWAKNKRGEAIGPYYLIWTNPSQSDIGAEEWPYQIVSIEISSEKDSDLAALLPAKTHKNFTQLKKGYDAFIKNCFGCHTINKKGQAELGPDLNFPYSPIEYFKKSYLIKYIRNPQSLRHWPQSRMPGFDKSKLSDQDLNHLVSYLEYLSQQKK